jgi:hypothetical protein
MLFWLRQAGVLLVIGLAVRLFPTIEATTVALEDFYQDFWARRASLRQEWRTERTGETILAPKVQAMLQLLRDNQVRSFRYSDAIARDADTSLTQRLAESAYPIRVDLEARYQLLTAGESVDVQCTAVARKQEVVLARCP